MPKMLPLIFAFVFYVLLVAVVTIAVLYRGARDEKRALAVFLATAAASQIMSLLGAHWRLGPEYGVMACDAALMVGLLAIVSSSRKFWPLWAAAASVVGLLTHAARWFKPSLAMTIYTSIQPFWAFPILFAMLIGASANKANRR